jgi:cystathionine beta-lyase
MGLYDYTRSGNPTRALLEAVLADLEAPSATPGATSAFAFSSGMAAITSVTRLVKAGESIVAGNDLYGGTLRLLGRLPDERGIGVVYVDTTGLEDCPGHVLHEHQAGGPGLLMRFTTGSNQLSEQIVNATRLFKIAVSFGSVTSVISQPARMSHANVPPEVRERRALPDGLVRLSVGLEDAGDLVADLAGAIQVAMRASVPARTSGHSAAVSWAVG